MHTTFEAYIAKVHLQLDELNAKVESLESKVQDAKSEIRANYRLELEKLHHQSKLASEQLAKVTAGGETSWNNMVHEMDKIRTAFMQSVNYFKSQF